MTDQADIASALVKLTDLVERADTAIAGIGDEVADLKETRYRPYFMSIGIFVAITIGTAGFVYRLEGKVIEALYGVQDRMGNNEARIATLRDSVQTLVIRMESSERRSLARLRGHEEEHNRIEARLQTVGKVLVELSQRQGNGD